MMKRITVYILLILSVFTLVSCESERGRPDIVTSMFTHYDFAKQIVGDNLEVSLLVPLGADIHSFEASSRDMVEINKSKLFIFTSLEIDTWIKDPKTIASSETIVLDMSKSYIKTDHLNLSLSTTPLNDDHDHDELHYWVDPINAIQMIDYILKHVITIDPEHKSYYETNANNYKAEIYTLHLEIESQFAHGPYADSIIYFAGHNALGAFGERYHIHIESLFSEFKPDDDLTSSEIINFSNLVRSANAHYLFTEALIQPKAAIAIKESLESNNQYQLHLLELHTYHNLNQKDWEANVTYKDLLQRNFEQIKIALGIIKSND